MTNSSDSDYFSLLFLWLLDRRYQIRFYSMPIIKIDFSFSFLGNDTEDNVNNKDGKHSATNSEFGGTESYLYRNFSNEN